ncbi:hypothetical protein JCM10207_002742 [Rhodosporidiobolus poonsookiae]
MATAKDAAAGGVAGKDAAKAVVTLETPAAGAVGVREAEYYERLMPRWRYDVRQRLLRNLEGEMDMLQRIQKRWRTPFRDEYFVKSSLLGTHTFFMVFLPLWFWYGLPEVGRGLLYVLAAGAYATSALKDAFSVPRPLSPPIVRLSVGSHALEYGFPSTHSSNACSMALFAGEQLLRRNTGEQAWLNPVGVVLLAVFAWSVTFGRLYTGMHSLCDVLTGSTIGTLLWLSYSRYSDALHALISHSGWTGTLSTISILLFVLSTHPEPAEPCPCFEDTVAFLSVVQGAMIGSAFSPRERPTATVGWEWQSGEEVAVWVGAVLVKLIGGISAILVWRIIAKQACHAVLPPLFRFFAPIIQLPRRGYQKATEYESYPPEAKLDPVPSILDLPSLVDDSHVSSSATSSSLLPSASERLRARTAASSAFTASTSAASSPGGSAPPSPRLPLALSKPSPQSAAHLEEEHKDADVLTKVIVYAGIGWIATIALPSLFERAGLSVWQ